MTCFNELLHLSRGFYVIIIFIQLKNTMNILMTKTCKLTVILILFILFMQYFNILYIMLNYASCNCGFMYSFQPAVSCMRL